jgi:hypothetical protein
VTQESATHPRFCSIFSLHPKSGRPLADSSTSKSSQHAQVKHRYGNSDQDADRFSRTGRGASPAAQHSGNESAKGDDSYQDDVVDEHGSAPQSKGCWPALDDLFPAMPSRLCPRYRGFFNPGSH